MSDSAKTRGRLTIVGIGIGLVGHVTLEALAAIKSAEKLFFVTGSAGASVWLRKLKPDAVSLHGCYGTEKERDQTYREMAGLIMEAVRAGHRTCAAFYGHPAVGVDPSHILVRQAAREGYAVRMLPGISAEACLYADLGFDPLSTGCQSFEATDFVQRRPTICTGAALLLWQIGVIGQLTARFTRDAYLPGIERLITALLLYYPGDHHAVVYEAALYPICSPMIVTVPIRSLLTAKVSPATTLFVPPLGSDSLFDTTGSGDPLR